MIKDLENKFFAELADEGAVTLCFSYLIDIYIYRREPVRTAEEVLNLVSKRTEAFDLAACPIDRKGRKNLAEEISDNLISLSEKQAEIYIIRILENFWGCGSVMIAGKEHDLFLEAVRTDKVGSIEWYGRIWYYRLFYFVRALAGVCAEHGINLLDIQEKRGIKIIDSLNVVELSFHTEDTSFEYAQTLLDNLNLPKGKHQKIDERLQTEEAKAYFQKAIEKGLMSEDYKWLEGKQLCACFCCEMSDKLNLGNGMTADGVKRKNWKIFDFLGIENLRGSLNDIQKIGTKPQGYEVIDEIFGK